MLPGWDDEEQIRRARQALAEQAMAQAPQLPVSREELQANLAAMREADVGPPQRFTRAAFYQSPGGNWNALPTSGNDEMVGLLRSMNPNVQVRRMATPVDIRPGGERQSLPAEAPRQQQPSEGEMLRQLLASTPQTLTHYMPDTVIAPTATLTGYSSYDRFGRPMGTPQFSYTTGGSVGGSPYETPNPAYNAILSAMTQRDVARMHYGPDAMSARIVEDMLKNRMLGGQSPQQASQGLTDLIGQVRGAFNGQPQQPITPIGSPPPNWMQTPANAIDAHGRPTGRPNVLGGMWMPPGVTQADFEPPTLEPSASAGARSQAVRNYIDRLRILNQRQPEFLRHGQNWATLRDAMERAYTPEAVNQAIYAGQLFGQPPPALMTLRQLDQMLPADRLRRIQATGAPIGPFSRTHRNIPVPPRPVNDFVPLGSY